MTNISGYGNFGPKDWQTKISRENTQKLVHNLKSPEEITVNKNTGTNTVTYEPPILKASACCPTSGASGASGTSGASGAKGNMVFDPKTKTFKEGTPPKIPEGKESITQNVVFPPGSLEKYGTVIYFSDGDVNVYIEYKDDKVQYLYYDSKTGTTEETWE